MDQTGGFAASSWLVRQVASDRGDDREVYRCEVQPGVTALEMSVCQVNRPDSSAWQKVFQGGRF